MPLNINKKGLQKNEALGDPTTWTSQGPHPVKLYIMKNERQIACTK